MGPVHLMLLFALGALVSSVVPLGFVLVSLGASRLFWRRGKATLLTWVLAAGTAVVAWVWAILLLPVWLVAWVFVWFMFQGSTPGSYLPFDPSPARAVTLAVFLVAFAAWFCAVGASVLLSGLQGSSLVRFWHVCTGLLGLLWSVPIAFLAEDPTVFAIALSNLIFLIPCELGLLGLFVTDIGTSVLRGARAEESRGSVDRLG